jgi:hypothetical protein
VQLHERFGKQGLQVVMHTQLFGRFKTDTGLTAKAEIAHLKTYYATEHGIPFPVGVDTSQLVPDPKNPAKLTRTTPKANAAYEVNGIPHLVVIDRQGIVRQVYVGWLGPDERSFLDTNTERVAAMVEKLLAEPAISSNNQ